MEREGALISSLIHCDDFGVLAPREDLAGAVRAVGKGFEVFLYIRDMIDIEKETTRLKKNIAKNEKLLGSTEKKLKNVMQSLVLKRF